MRLKTILLAGFMLISASAAFAAPMRIVALGDSLTAGYGLQPGEDYPSQLEKALQDEGIDVVIENAGVSGDTTSGGVSRLEWAIEGDVKPSLVIVALGANDMLRGISPDVTKKNLRTILQALKDKKIPAVLYGMQASSSLPLVYRAAFSNVYEDLADDFDVPFYPFFLEGVVMDPKLNLGDGVHPNKAGVAVMVKRTVSLIEDALDD